MLKKSVKSCHQNFVKSVRIWRYSSPHFSAFGLNTEKYSVYLRIQSEWEKMRTRITPNRDTFYAVQNSIKYFKLDENDHIVCSCNFNCSSKYQLTKFKLVTLLPWLEKSKSIWVAKKLFNKTKSCSERKILCRGQWKLLIPVKRPLSKPFKTFSFKYYSKISNMFAELF